MKIERPCHISRLSVGNSHGELMLSLSLVVRCPWDDADGDELRSWIATRLSPHPVLINGVNGETPKDAELSVECPSELLEVSAKLRQLDEDGLAHSEALLSMNICELDPKLSLSIWQGTVSLGLKLMAKATSLPSVSLEDLCHLRNDEFTLELEPRQLSLGLGSAPAPAPVPAQARAALRRFKDQLDRQGATLSFELGESQSPLGGEQDQHCTELVPGEGV